MKSQLSPIFQVYSSNGPSGQITINTVLTFIQNFSFSERSTTQLFEDEQFSKLIHIFNSILNQNAIESSSNLQNNELSRNIVNFLYSICNFNPFVINLISRNFNLDVFIPGYFDAFIESNDFSETSMKAIFPFLRFIVIICQSKNIMLSSTQSFESIIKLIDKLLDLSPLAAWAGSLLADLSSNHQPFLSFYKSHTLNHQIQEKLKRLLESSDNYIKLSSLASLSLSTDLLTETKSIISTSIKLLSIDTQFPMTPILSSWIIITLEKYCHLENDTIIDIFRIAINSTGSRAYYLYRLLTQISDLGYVILNSNSNETHIFLSHLIEQLITSESNFLMITISNFLDAILDRNPEIIIPIQHNEQLIQKTFTRLTKCKVYEDQLMIESLINVLRILISCKIKMQEPILSYIKDKEDYILEMFLRHIKNKDYQITLGLFHLIIEISISIPDFLIQFRRILADSTFSDHVIHVLSTSESHKYISDAIFALHFILTGAKKVSDSKLILNSLYFQQVMMNFVNINQKTTSQINSLQVELIHEKETNSSRIQILESQSSSARSENQLLKSQIEEEKNQSKILSESSNKTLSKLSEEIEKCYAGLKKDKNEIKRLNALRCKEQQDTTNIITGLKNENKQKDIEIEFLKKQMKVYRNFELENEKLNKEIKRLINKTQKQEALVQITNEQLKKIKEAKLQLEVEFDKKDNYMIETQTNCNKMQQQYNLLLSDLNKEKQLSKEKSDSNQHLHEENELLRQKNIELKKKIHLLREKYSHYDAEENIVEKIKEKYERKKKELFLKLEESQKETEKWKKFAEFSNHVHMIKKESIQSVYGNDVFVE